MKKRKNSHYFLVKEAGGKEPGLVALLGYVQNCYRFPWGSGLAKVYGN